MGGEQKLLHPEPWFGVSTRGRCARGVVPAAPVPKKWPHWAQGAPAPAHAAGAEPQGGKGSCWLSPGSRDGDGAEDGEQCWERLSFAVGQFLEEEAPFAPAAAALCCGLTRQGHGESSGTGAATAGGSPVSCAPAGSDPGSQGCFTAQFPSASPCCWGNLQPSHPMLPGPSGPRGAPGQWGLFHPHPKAGLAAPRASQLLVLLFPCPPPG